MRPELTGCFQLPTGTVKLDLTLATQALIWRCHFFPSFVFLHPSFSLSHSVHPSIYPIFSFVGRRIKVGLFYSCHQASNIFKSIQSMLRRK